MNKELKTSQAGIDLIKSFEGFRPAAYICPAGKLTIGYGHTYRVQITDQITEAEAEEFLRRDVADAESAIRYFVTAKLKQNQFDALVSFIYNVGIGNFSRSTLLKKINSGPDRNITIAKEFRKWIFSKGNKLKGLINRREAEILLYTK